VGTEQPQKPLQEGSKGPSGTPRVSPGSRPMRGPGRHCCPTSGLARHPWSAPSPPLPSGAAGTAGGAMEGATGQAQARRLTGRQRLVPLGGARRGLPASCPRGTQPLLFSQYLRNHLTPLGVPKHHRRQWFGTGRPRVCRRAGGPPKALGGEGKSNPPERGPCNRPAEQPTVPWCPCSSLLLTLPA